MTETIQILRDWGPWGLLVLIVIFVITNPEKAERLAGWFLGFFSWTSRGIRHRSIKLKLQGQVNSFARTFDTEAKGSMPYNMSLNFVKEVERSELDPSKQTVIVCIKDRGGEDQNLVHAMMVFCPLGVVPQARPYLSSPMNEAINMTVTRKFLNYLKHVSALQYLYNEILPECMRITPGLDEFCKIFDILDESGLFTRVVLEEIRDFGARISSRYPEALHAAEAASFVNYVCDVATRQKGEEMLDIGYRGQYIATAFVFIGIGEAMLQRGAMLYLDHLRRLRDARFEKAYLAARGIPKKGTVETSLSINMAERVGYLAERAKLAKRGRTMRYYAITQQGESRLHTLIELIMVPPKSP